MPLSAQHFRTSTLATSPLQVWNSTLHCGDALQVLPTLEAGSIHCVVTSPPYWGLRDYGGWRMQRVWDGGWGDFILPKRASRRQVHRLRLLTRAARKGHIYAQNGTTIICALGLEPTPELYTRHMVQVFREVRRVLRDDGTVWLNLGDSYANDGKWGGTTGGKHAADLHGEQIGRGKRSTGLKPKDLVGIPWRVAFALQADGWYLRQDIIWAKPNPMPESVTDRCTKAHEYLFLLTKKPRYFYDHEAMKEPAVYAGKTRGGSTKRYEQNKAGMDNKVYNTRNRRSVWTIKPQPFKGAHFAVFPEALVEPCILAGTSAKGCCPECGAPWKRDVETSRTFESGSGRSGNPIGGKQDAVQGGGETLDIRRGPVTRTTTLGWQSTCKCLQPSTPCTVLDPFMGSGTVGLVANRMFCRFIGIELKLDYLKLAVARIQGGSSQCP